MSRRNKDWGPENDDVVHRLREERPQLDARGLDRVKATVMARVRPRATVKPKASPRFAPQMRLVVALVTFGLMAAGTAGAIASSPGGLTSTGSGAAQSQYKPPKCHPLSGDRLECKCPHHSSAACVCPTGTVVTTAGGHGGFYCVCPNGGPISSCYTPPPKHSTVHGALSRRASAAVVAGSASARRAKVSVRASATNKASPGTKSG